MNGIRKYYYNFHLPPFPLQCWLWVYTEHILPYTWHFKVLFQLTVRLWFLQKCETVYTLRICTNNASINQKFHILVVISKKLDGICWKKKPRGLNVQYGMGAVHLGNLLGRLSGGFSWTFVLFMFYRCSPGLDKLTLVFFCLNLFWHGLICFRVIRGVNIWKLLPL